MEGGAGALGGIDGDGPAVFLDKDPGVVEAEARTFGERFGREERIKDMSQVPLGNAGAVVLYRQASTRHAGEFPLSVR